ncbi:MAG: right-handed parallel beta-helix repeat-containing protein, partial [Verrucomicrobia bacterium]|nr:right-handed parallel beta-helix repeat-containing protein [Verrucomicrobiota bacterium]
VWIGGGVYPLSDTFVLGFDDSASSGNRIDYVAVPGEQPVLSGGRRITGWKVKKDRWVVTLPDVAKGDWDFAQLFVDGERRSRPRLPREGYHYVAGKVASSPQCEKGDHDRFMFKKGDLKPTWHNLADVEVLIFHEWSTSRCRLSDVDNSEMIATVVGGSTRHAINRGTRFLVENVKEVQIAGEWYLDRKSGELTYFPLPGETPGETVVVAPCLHRVMEIKGNVTGKAWVENLHFVGITFAHANWTTPPMGNSIPQAESTMPAAVHVEGARNCSFKECVFTLMGGYCLELGDGSQHNIVEECEFTNIGAGGVKIGPTRTFDEDVLASHNTVRNCLVAHLGRIHPSGVGILACFGHHIVIEHNDIYDLYYSGISMGWSWNYDPTPNHDNVINYNRIHDALQVVLTDGAGIYTLGLQLDSVMRGNVLYNIEGVPWAVGIYLDQGSTGWICEDNLVYHVTTHDFNVNFGRDNIARNNIFGPILDPGAPLLRCGTIENHRSMTIEKNLIYFTVGDLVDNAWPTWPVENCLVRRNLYWNAAGLPVKIRDRSWAYWQSTGQDEGSIIADPMFVDPEDGDFRLKPGSPASRIGFKPFDISKAGRLAKDPAELETLFPRAFPESLWNPPYMYEIPDSDPADG